MTPHNIVETEILARRSMLSIRAFRSTLRRDFATYGRLCLASYAVVEGTVLFGCTDLHYYCYCGVDGNNVCFPGGAW